jgi:hypothetical protein
MVMKRVPLCIAAAAAGGEPVGPKRRADEIDAAQSPAPAGRPIVAIASPPLPADTASDLLARLYADCIPRRKKACRPRP